MVVAQPTMNMVVMLQGKSPIEVFNMVAVAGYSNGCASG